MWYKIASKFTFSLQSEFCTFLLEGNGFIGNICKG